MNKIILSAKPSIGFNYLFDTGLLHKIFPQMTALYGVEYIDGKGHKDNFYHTLAGKFPATPIISETRRLKKNCMV